MHFFLTLAGTYAIFMPMHYLGMAGQPRRYSQFTELAYLQHLIPLNTFITYAAIITIAAQFIFVINLFWSMFKGPKASDNPWEATTLEWTTATPPPHDNFGGKTPVVYHGPYEYSVPGAPKDYVMQTDPATYRHTSTNSAGESPAPHSSDMATFSSTVTITDPVSQGSQDRPRPRRHASACSRRWWRRSWRRRSPDYGERLRRTRLGLLVGLVASTMVFVSFTSVYIMRRGLPTLDDRTGGYVRDWLQVNLPTGLLLVNTLLLVLSSITVELARRQITRQAALAPVQSIPGVSIGKERNFPWLGATVVLGLAFLTGQWMAWRELADRGFYLATSPSSSMVYLLTATHAVHLAGGSAGVAVRGRHCAAAPASGRPPHRGRRDRLVLALHGFGLDLHFCSFGVCALDCG